MHIDYVASSHHVPHTICVYAPLATNSKQVIDHRPCIELVHLWSVVVSMGPRQIGSDKSPPSLGNTSADAPPGENAIHLGWCYHCHTYCYTFGVVVSKAYQTNHVKGVVWWPGTNPVV